MTTDPHPLLAGLREEIIAYLKRTTVDDEWTEQSADTIVELLHERLGPVLEAAQKVRDCYEIGPKYPDQMPPGAVVNACFLAYDECVKRAGRPGGGMKAGLWRLVKCPRCGTAHRIKWRPWTNQHWALGAFWAWCPRVKQPIIHLPFDIMTSGA